MSDQSTPSTSERLLALLSLAAKSSPRSESDVCPSAGELAAFAAQQLEGEARQRLMAHLNRCPSCLDQWLSVATSLPETSQVAAPLVPERPLAGVGRFFPTWLSGWRLTVPAAAVVAVLCILWLGSWWVAPELDAQITARYAVVLEQDPETSARQHLETLVMGQGVRPLAFSEAQPNLAQRAFGAGTWAGMHTLLGAGKAPDALPDGLSAPSVRGWDESSRADHYAFGRWTIVLLWDSIQSESISADWDAHAAIAAELLARFASQRGGDSNSVEAESALHRILLLLKTLQDQAGPAGKERLSRQLLMTVQLLGPAS